MLHKLIEYADSHGISGVEGFSSKRIRFLIQFSPQGEYLGLYDYGKNGSEFSDVPHLQFSGDTPKRQFLVDTIDFFALYPANPESGLKEAVNVLKEAVPRLLAELENEADFEAIRSLSEKVMTLLAEKKYLELREKDPEKKGLKKKWEELLEKRGRGRRSEIKLFFGKKGPVNAVFNNGEFKRIGKHQFCLRLLQQAAEVEPSLGAIAKVMSDQSVLEKIHDDLLAAKPVANRTNNVTFAILDNDDLKILVRESSLHGWWKTRQTEHLDNISSKDARCFLSGEEIHPLLTHPKIKGLSGVGGNAETSLISFKEGRPSFQSYGFVQSENAAISVESAVKYASAVNHLLNHQHHRLAGAEIIYWYSKNIQVDEDIINAAFSGFGDFEEDDDDTEVNIEQQEVQAHINAKQFLKSVAEGECRELRDVQYCALTLQGNKGRAVVQNWMEGCFVDLAVNIEQWFSDLEITRLSGIGFAKLPKIETLITCLLKEKKPRQEYSDWIKPVTGFRDAIWCAVVGGREVPFPENTVRLALLRLRESTLTEEWANALDINGEQMGMRRARLYARIGLIKAYLIRNTKQEIAMGDRKEIKNSVYWLGDLFAVLADLQRSAHQSGGGTNVQSTIVDRFYTTASTCPKLVYGRLLAQSQHHLRKLENKNKKAAEAINREIATISQRIDFDEVPDMLPLPEQSWFALGYYQQIAEMNRRKAVAAANKRVNSKKGEN